MTTRNVSARLRFCLLAVMFAVLAAPASAATILVREEFGFGFIPGQQWTLEEDGPAATYDLTGFAPGGLFELRYANDFFFMTALFDNAVADAGSLPFGIDVYPGGVTPMPPDSFCDIVRPCYNGLGFTPWFNFPMLAGEFISIAVPPVGAVSEPGSVALLAAALVLLGWTTAASRRRPLTRSG